MYYISRFCRICIQTDVKLLDIDTLDFDEVKLSEKLEVCTKMVVNRESLSTDICVHCITKLRVSYQFHDMCKKSTKTLQGYLEALFCSTDINTTSKKFVNTELNVLITPLTRYVNDGENVQTHRDGTTKRKRITKEQRCSLLKRLLTPTEKYKKERDKYVYDPSIYYCDYKGGLRNIIRFTKNYEFGLKLDKNSNYEPTPLDKLTAFSDEFFRKDFTEFQNTILYIIENKDNLYDSDEEDLFNIPVEDENVKEEVVKFEEVIVEPDIKIKTEMDFEEDVESYGNIETECKTELPEHYDPSSFSDFTRSFQSNSSIQLLDNLVGGYNQRRTFSQSNVRCRTRDNPYINPALKNQFLYRSFKCERCNRYFKSPGYLKAHHSKVH